MSLMGRIFKIAENNKAESPEIKVMGLFYFGRSPSLVRSECFIWVLRKRISAEASLCPSGAMTGPNGVPVPQRSISMYGVAIVGWQREKKFANSQSRTKHSFQIMKANNSQCI